MENMTSDPLALFNQLYKEMDEIYHQYAKRQGISDTALWLGFFPYQGTFLLYPLYEDGAGYTQRELCSAWHYPPQTINSALKNLVNQGYIQLKPVEGNQKNKRIVLTEAGNEMMQEIISPLIRAEKRTFQRLEKSERDALLSLTHKYVSLLKSEVK